MTTLAKLKELDGRPRELIETVANDGNDFNLPDLHLGVPQSNPASGEIAEEMFDRIDA
jgi:hypothetical protein